MHESFDVARHEHRQVVFRASIARDIPVAYEPDVDRDITSIAAQSGSNATTLEQRSSLSRDDVAVPLVCAERPQCCQSLRADASIHSKMSNR